VSSNIIWAHDERRRTQLIASLLPRVLNLSPGTPTFHSPDRLITAQDHASIQIQVADVDADGKAIKGQATTIAICGRIRAQGDSDDSINRIATKEGRECCTGFASDRDRLESERPESKTDWPPVLKNVWTYSH
jgi:hypothetical protein